METTIRINTDKLDMDILEGIRKMFPHEEVEITTREEYVNELSKHFSSSISRDENATQFILNRSALANEWQPSRL